MNSYFEKLKVYIEAHPPNYGDGESVLTMLCECHNENSPYDNEQIKEDFNELYPLMNGMELQEMDRIIYPVCMNTPRRMVRIDRWPWCIVTV